MGSASPGRSHRGALSCPLTESGFVRVSSNQRVTPGASTPAEAIALLRRVRRLEGHVFWTNEVSPDQGLGELAGADGRDALEVIRFKVRFVDPLAVGRGSESLSCRSSTPATCPANYVDGGIKRRPTMWGMPIESHWAPQT